MQPQLCTITELAALFGKNERTMRNWLSGLAPDVPGGNGRGHAAKWTLPRVVSHRFERGGGAEDAGPLNLEEQRARQAKETADKLALENAVTRGELAPLSYLEEQMIGYTRQVGAMLDGIGPNLRRVLPHLSNADHQRIENTITAERNRLAAGLGRDTSADEGGDPESGGRASRPAKAAA